MQEARRLQEERAARRCARDERSCRRRTTPSALCSALEEDPERVMSVDLENAASGRDLRGTRCAASETPATSGASQQSGFPDAPPRVAESVAQRRGQLLFATPSTAAPPPPQPPANTGDGRGQHGRRGSPPPPLPQAPATRAQRPDEDERATAAGGAPMREVKMKRRRQKPFPLLWESSWVRRQEKED